MRLINNALVYDLKTFKQNVTYIFPFPSNFFQCHLFIANTF